MGQRLPSLVSSAYLYTRPIAVQANGGGAFRTFVSSASNDAARRQLKATQWEPQRGAGKMP